MNEEQATAESSSECSSLNSRRRGQGLLCSPSSREAGGNQVKGGAERQLLALLIQHFILTAKEKLLL